LANSAETDLWREKSLGKALPAPRICRRKPSYEATAMQRRRGAGAIAQERAMRDTGTDETKPTPTFRFYGRTVPMPRSRLVRILVGGLLVFLGLFFGFLPVLGYWMAPLGLIVLSYDIAVIRRLRRRLVVWWERRRKTSETRPD
jgi:hypothetical protein